MAQAAKKLDTVESVIDGRDVRTLAKDAVIEL